MASLLRSVVLVAALWLPALASAVPVLPDFEAATFVPGAPAAPGFIMPAEPAVGFEYFQEFAPDDEAVDQARVFSIVPLLDTPLGELADVVQILETNPLEPDDREFKLYAPGRGLVRVEEGLDPSFAHPEARFDLVRVTLVPEPSIFALLVAGVAMVIGMARRRRAP